MPPSGSVAKFRRVWLPTRRSGKWFATSPSMDAGSAGKGPLRGSRTTGLSPLYGNLLKDSKGAKANKFLD